MESFVTSGELQVVKDSMTTITKELINAVKNISDLGSKINEIVEKINNLESITNRISDLDRIESRLASVETIISNLNSNNSNITKQVFDFKDNIYRIREEFDSVKDYVAKNNEKIDSVDMDSINRIIGDYSNISSRSTTFDIEITKLKRLFTEFVENNKTKKRTKKE